MGVIPDLVITLPEVSVGFASDSGALNPNNTGINPWIWVWIIGSVILLGRLIINLMEIRKLIISASREKYGTISYLITDKDITPFSFFRYIMIPASAKNAPELDQILEHEQIHVKHLHTLDILVLEILAVFFWMNPFIWFYRLSLKGAHEYSADRGVMDKGFNRERYMEMMVNRVFGMPYSGPIHSFNSSQLKNRIIMMTKKKNNRMAGITSLIAWPLVAVLVVLTSGAFRSQAHFPSNSEQLLPDLTLSVKDYISPAGEDTTVFVSVDEMPVFSKGGQDGLMQYIGKTVKYPDNSRKEGIQGKVFISFLVDTDGKVKDVQLLRIQAFKMEGEKQVRCEAPDLVEESLRVIRSLPDFTPGKNKGKPVKVKMTVPIQFKLSEDGKK
jgi:hypothetical protein